MDAFASFCRAARFPLDIAMYILLTLAVFASGALQLWLQTWRWPLAIVIFIALIVHGVSRRPSAQQLQEGFHVR